MRELSEPTPSSETDWNAAAARFSELEFSTEWQVGYPAAAEVLKPRPGRSILDYGCGEGKFARFLAAAGAEVEGVDVSPRMIELARRRDGKGASFRLIESANLHDYRDRHFDGAAACWVFCTIADSLEVTRIARSIGRVLKNQASLVVLENNPEGFGSVFSSFSVDRPVQFQIDSPSRVTTHLRSQEGGDLRVIDHYWPDSDLTKLIEKDSGLSLSSIKRSQIEERAPGVSKIAHAPRSPFRLLEFRRR